MEKIKEDSKMFTLKKWNAGLFNFLQDDIF